MATSVHTESVLLVTLDSCRFDTADAAGLHALARYGRPAWTACRIRVRVSRSMVVGVI